MKLLLFVLLKRRVFGRYFGYGVNPSSFVPVVMGKCTSRTEVLLQQSTVTICPEIPACFLQSVQRKKPTFCESPCSRLLPKRSGNTCRGRRPRSAPPANSARCSPPGARRTLPGRRDRLSSGARARPLLVPDGVGDEFIAREVVVCAAGRRRRRHANVDKTSRIARRRRRGKVNGAGESSSLARRPAGACAPSGSAFTPFPCTRVGVTYVCVTNYARSVYGARCDVSRRLRVAGDEEPARRRRGVYEVKNRAHMLGYVIDRNIHCRRNSAVGGDDRRRPFVCIVFRAVLFRLGVPEVATCRFCSVCSADTDRKFGSESPRFTTWIVARSRLRFRQVT